MIPDAPKFDLMHGPVVNWIMVGHRQVTRGMRHGILERAAGDVAEHRRLDRRAYGTMSARPAQLARLLQRRALP